MSNSLIAQQKMIKTPPLLVMSKIKNYRTSSTHMTVCQCNWPISWPPPHWPPGRTEKKNGCHIWPNYDIKKFFQKKFKCTPCPQYWTVTSTLVPLEHSRKQQNVGYTNDTIGCSLKQPKKQLVINFCRLNSNWGFSIFTSWCRIWSRDPRTSLQNFRWPVQNTNPGGPQVKSDG